MPVVTLPAEIDLANAPAIAARLEAAVASGVRVIIADMTATIFCDSSGIRMLILASDHAAGNHAELRLLAPGNAVLRLMAILGADKLVTICPGLEEALAPPQPLAG
jgi:anti-sigma B factor antagonist